MKASFVPVLPTAEAMTAQFLPDLYIGVVCVQRQTDECTLPLDQVRAIAVAASLFLLIPY